MVEADQQSPVEWLDSKPFGVQLLILAAIFDPLGLALGYVFHPQMGVDPFLGMAIGLFLANTPTSVWVLRHTLDEK